MEVPGDVRKRGRVVHDLHEHVVAEAQARAGDDAGPVDAAQRQVFAHVAGADGVALGLQGFDDLDREEAEGALRAAVRCRVALPVAGDAVGPDGGAVQGGLGDAAVGDADLDDRSVFARKDGFVGRDGLA